MAETEKTTEERYAEAAKKSNEAAERLEKANARTAELLAKIESERVQKMLDGKADAGTAKEKTPEELDTEAAKNLLRGTGFEDRI